MALGQAKTKKSAPVPISDPIENMSLWVTFKNTIKSAEKEIESLKDTIKSYVPQIAGTSRAYTATRLNYKGNVEEGEYVVKYIEQDRRSVSPELLTQLLNSKENDGTIKSAKAYCKLVADEEKVAQLLTDGKITKDELAACLSGPITKYTQCEWKAKK